MCIQRYNCQHVLIIPFGTINLLLQGQSARMCMVRTIQNYILYNQNANYQCPCLEAASALLYKACENSSKMCADSKVMKLLCRVNFEQHLISGHKDASMLQRSMLMHQGVQTDSHVMEMLCIVTFDSGHSLAAKQC